MGVNSTPGSGSCFHVSVPAVRAGAIAATARTAAPAEGTPLLAGRVLLVDDSEISRDVTVAQLQSLGWQVTAVVNGHDGWACWRQGAFDVVLTDLDMPGMDGYSLARRLRTDGAGIPIVVLTATALPEDAVRAHAAGMSHVLLKPLDLGALQNALQHVDAAAGRAAPGVTMPMLSDAVQTQMRDAFLQTARCDLAAVRQAMETADTTTLIDRLHWFAGAMVFLGYRAAAQRCQQAEQALRATSAADTAAMMRVSEALAMTTASVAACERLR